MTTGRHATPPSKPDVETFLRTSPAAARDMLRIFTEAGDDGSVAYVAAALLLDKRLVARDLKLMSEQFRKLTGGPLIQRLGKNYELTPAAKLLGEELISQHRLLVETVRHAAMTYTEARIPVTENLLTALTRLQTRVRRDEDISLLPDPRRSADLLPPDYRRDESRGSLIRRKFAYAMYSMCADASDLREGRLGSVPGDESVQVAVIRIEQFKLLAATRTFGRQPRLGVEEIWDNCQFVVPDGGAVRTFLTEIERGWESRRGYTEATDYNCCMACLVNDSVPNLAMVVHGAVQPPPGYAIYEIKDETPLAAVTGVFRRDNQADKQLPQKREVWNKIWAAAVAEFSTNAVEGGAAWAQ